MYWCFLENYKTDKFNQRHLNNGHTIKTTRGFKRTQQGTAASPDASNSYHPQYQQQQQQPYQQQQQSAYPHPTLRSNRVNQGFNSTTSVNNDSNNHNYNSVTSHKDIKHIVESTLGSGVALAQAVKLPRDENINEWLAVHVVDFYNQINMLYGTITEFCSPKTCPRMTATSEYEYLWQDSNLTKPVSVSAPKYVESLMLWIQSLLDDENIFPPMINQPFPPQFQSLVKTIMKRLFRIYAHIYCHHFNEVIELGLNTLLNTSFKHFLLFSDEFNLIANKDFGPLQTLVIEMLVQDDDDNGNNNYENNNEIP